MGRKFRDVITTNHVRVKQKNGDIYVYERTYKYNQDTKKNECQTNRLIGKIPKGTDEMVPTRPKRPKGTSKTRGNSNSPVEATETSHILGELLDWAGKESGIDEDLLASMSKGDALKTASLARFWTATQGATVPNIETWQLTHPIPYRDGMSAGICYDLFENLGRDTSARQSLFDTRARRLGDHPMIAYDSTTISTWSELLETARYGYNKDHDGNPTVKYLMLYAVDTMQPVAYAKQSGNIPDVSSIERAINQLSSLGVSKPQLVTDSGFYSEDNLAELCHTHLDFISLITSSPWITPLVEEAIPVIDQLQYADPESDTFVKTFTVKHMFTYERKRGNAKKNLKAGDKETFNRRLYIHVCFNPEKKLAEDRALQNRIQEIKRMLEAGMPFSDLTKAAQTNARTYLKFRLSKEGIARSIKWNQEKFDKACRFHGFFVLVASHEKDGFECLHRYRKREKIEEFFGREKEDVDGNTTRVSSDNRLEGRMLVQFATLCYDDFFRSRILQVKQKLRESLANPDPDRLADDITLDKKVLAWLEHMSFHNVLAWFDVYKNIHVSSQIRNKRWNDETTRRDRRFLQLLTGTDFT